MQNYEFIKTIGTGSFARVELSQNIKTNEYVAIKIIRKNRAFDLSQQVHTIWEYQLLSKLSHPFIVEIHKMHQDKFKIYFIMEYVIGGELFCLMKKAGKFKEIHTAFYSAQMVLALHFLHKNNIIYRALVPENILIDSNGYLKLTDFGFSKKLRLPSTLLYGYLRMYYAQYRRNVNYRNRNAKKLKYNVRQYLSIDEEKEYDSFKTNDEYIVPIFNENIISCIRRFSQIDETYTLCGTPEYVAPEILLNTGYSFEVDFWSLGIIIYELLTTVTPFAIDKEKKTNDDTIHDIYGNILSAKYTTRPFPPTHLSASCKDLLSKLLVINPHKRLGSERGAMDIMSHSFYSGINWVRLLQKKMKKVPWIPVTQHEADTIYFEEYDEEIESELIAVECDVFERNAFDRMHFDNAVFDDECKLVAFMIHQTDTIEFNHNGLLNMEQFMYLMKVLQLDDVYDENVFERIFYFMQKGQDIPFIDRKDVCYISYSDIIGCNYDELRSIIQHSNNQDFHVLLSKLVLDQLQWVHDKILDGIRTKRDDDMVQDDEDHIAYIE